MGRLVSGIKRTVIGVSLVTLLIIVISSKSSIPLLILVEVASLICVFEVSKITNKIASGQTQHEKRIECVSGDYFVVFLSAFYPFLVINSPKEVVIRNLFCVHAVSFALLQIRPFLLRKKIDVKNFVAAQLSFFNLSFVTISLSLCLAILNEKKYLGILIPGIAAAADAGGLIFGKSFSKKNKETGGPNHPLSPVLSPNKSIEGVVGAIICSVLTGLLCPHVLKLATRLGGMEWNNPDSTLYFVVYSFILSILAVFGDLFESYVKRVANVKDSSKILGRSHGGMFDRLDSALFSFPFCYLLYYFNFEQLFM